MRRPRLRGGRMIIDANVQPHFRYNAEIRKFLASAHKLRSIPDVEQ